MQQFGEDFLPLILLFAISVTGLMLTASYTWMKGYAYDFLAILHAVTVIFTLLWLPFGKFFHIFQRPAQLGVSFYKDVGARRPSRRSAAAAAQPFASATAGRGPDRRSSASSASATRSTAPGAEHYQRICPRLPAGAVRPGPGRGCGQPRADGGPARHGHRSPSTTPRTHSASSARTCAVPAGAAARHGVEPDRLVKTHCCFCGQQCGIQLKVKDNEVIGFEPWEEFPFNHGMLCPKGVKRYLQGSHPDRLLTAPTPRPVGARRASAPMPYDEAIARVAVGDRAHPDDVRPRRLRRARRREPDDREDAT